MGAGNLSYLFTWQGSQPDLDPVLFVSHTDVVPVAQETLKVGCLGASTQAHVSQTEPRLSTPQLQQHHTSTSRVLHGASVPAVEDVQPQHCC